MSVPGRSRAELVAAQARRPPFGDRSFGAGDGPVRVGITGSADALLLLAWSEGDLARECEVGGRVFGHLGIAAGMRVANALPGALATPGALIVGDVNEALGVLDVPLGVVDAPQAAAAAWELLDRVEVNVLVLDPARCEPLLAGMPAHPRPWFAGIVWCCVPGGSPPPVVTVLPGWRRRWVAVPEVSSFVAGECTGGALHVDPAFVPTAEGGELVLGPLHPGIPWRYRTGWPVRALGTCGCGTPGPTLAP